MVTMDLSTWQGLRARDPRRLALGTAQWGMPYGIANRDGEPGDAEVVAMLARARRAGIHTLETARGYGCSEVRIGAAIQPGDGWRVVTKLDPDVHRAEYDVAQTLEALARSLETSRSALATDSLPVVMLHRFSHRHACGGRLWRALLAEREAGRIGALGVCTATPEEAWAALEDADLEVLQVASSLLDLRLYRQGFFPRARELGRSVYVHGIFLQGLALLDPRTLPPSLDALGEPMRAIRQCAARLDVEPRALFVAFARELPGIHPILGCERDDQLAALLADWGSERIDSATLSSLLDTLPTLEAELVDPSCWVSSEMGQKNRVNQTATGSVATIPT